MGKSETSPASEQEKNLRFNRWDRRLGLRIRALDIAAAVELKNFKSVEEETDKNIMSRAEMYLDWLSQEKE